MEGVVGRGQALGVVLVPVDAGHVGGLVGTVGKGAAVAHHPRVEGELGQIPAEVHARVLGRGADVVPLLVDVVVVLRHGPARCVSVTPTHFSNNKLKNTALRKKILKVT